MVAVGDHNCAYCLHSVISSLVLIMCVCVCDACYCAFARCCCMEPHSFGHCSQPMCVTCRVPCGLIDHLYGTCKVPLQADLYATA
jgi:hypothetical protein